MTYRVIYDIIVVYLHAHMRIIVTHACTHACPRARPRTRWSSSPGKAVEAGDAAAADEMVPEAPRSGVCRPLKQKPRTPQG